MENLKEMGNVLNSFKPLKLTREEINNLNRPHNKVVERVINISWKEKKEKNIKKSNKINNDNNNAQVQMNS